VAVEALAAAGVKVAENDVKAGLESVRWPARIEVLRRRPLTVVDCAHTADSARRLRDTLEEYLRVDGATMIVGVMGDKDLEGLAMAIEPLTRRVIATRADHPRALAPDAVARVFRDLGIETSVQAGVADALDAAAGVGATGEAIVVLGSVALAGEARAHVLGLERDPPIA
jgi:dihydrofolate synthase/folylpolyglutamate synthase